METNLEEVLLSVRNEAEQAISELQAETRLSEDQKGVRYWHLRQAIQAIDMTLLPQVKIGFSDKHRLEFCRMMLLLHAGGVFEKREVYD